jgi:hypothetical protein
MPRRPKKGSPPSSGSAATGSAPLHDDWHEFLATLLSRNIRFVLIGGHAVAVHAEARFTEDLDVLVDPAPTNARKLHAALVDFGFGSMVPDPDELTERDQVWMLGRKPYRIDVLTSVSGVSFARAWKNRVIVEIAGLDVPVIGRAELIANKRAAGRDKDRFDLAMLAKYPPRKKR